MNNKRTYDLDELRDAWQAFGARLDKACDELPPPQLHFVDTASLRRQTASAVALAVACILALVWLLCLPARYVADTLDLLPHIAVGLLLLYAIAASLLAAFRGFRFVPATLRAPGLMAAIAVAAIVLIAATPVYQGRALSAGGDRVAAVQATFNILNNVA